MLRSSLPKRSQRVSLQPFSHRLFSNLSRRAVASSPNPSSSSQSNRIDRILCRTPKFLRPTLSALHNAPLTHITAFLLLHELTAIIPLFGLVGAFHYFQWLPPFLAEGRWVLIGVEKFGNYFRRKGWIDAGDERKAEALVESEEGRSVEKEEKPRRRFATFLGRSRKGEDERETGKGRVSKWWGRGESGTRLVVEFATAYAVVKLLLPLRLVLSAWGAASFARWTVIPFNNMIQGWFRKSRPVGTGAVAGRVNAGGSKAVNGENIKK
jgi:Hypothetical protein FLILHELTA